MIRIIIADDHTLFRVGLKQMLHSFSGLDVVREATNAAEALAFDAAAHTTGDPHRSLSPHEWQVLRLIAQEVMLSQIAGQLHLSPKTITTHKSHLIEKLGIGTNADLIRYAIERRLFD